MSISIGDAVIIEGGLHEGEEGRVLGFTDDQADLDIFGAPGTRTVPVDYLVDSPATENEDWSSDSDTEGHGLVDFDTYTPNVPDELEGFEMNDRVKATDCIDKRFVGATGRVIDAEKIGGEWSVMVFLDMPHDRERDFHPDNLELIEKS